MSNILTTTIFILSIGGSVVNAFSPSSLCNQKYNQDVSLLLKMSTNDDNNNNNNISGSFFNPVPDKDKNEGNDDNKKETKIDSATDNVDPFDLNMIELMRRRNQKPLASNPSTVGGVLTSDTKGGLIQSILSINLLIITR